MADESDVALRGSPQSDMTDDAVKVRIMRAICCPVGGCAAERGNNRCWVWEPRYKADHERQAVAVLAIIRESVCPQNIRGSV